MKLGKWLAAHGVKSGQWYGEAKAFCAAAARASDLSADALMCLFCLRLHTIAYKSELAVKMVKGKPEPFRPTDLSEETGLTRQNVRRCLVELEYAGYSKREAIGEGGLHKGNVQIYCWLLPRAPARVEKNKRPDHGLPAEVVRAMNRFRIQLPKDFVATSDYKAFVEAALRDYKKADIVAVGKLKEAFFVAPGAPAYKEDRNYLKETTERGVPPPPPGSVDTSATGGVAIDRHKAEEEEDLPPTFASLKALYPSQRFDEGKVKPIFAKLPLAERVQVIWRLRSVWLRCERWQDAKGRWIPFCSTWLKSYESDPPPVLRKHDAAAEKIEQEGDSLKRTIAMAKFFRGGKKP